MAALLAIVEDASKEALKIYAEDDYGIQIKGDKSPVTRADLEVNRILTETLEKLTPNIPVVSEEANPDWEFRKDLKIFWIIDPIDGTKEFIKKSNEFTINLGLVENGYPVFGIIAIPCTGEIFCGGQALESQKGKQAAFVRRQKIVDGCFVRRFEEFKILARDIAAITRDGAALTGAPELGIDITCSKDHRHPDDWTFIENISKEHYIKLKPCGSTIKICRIAEGEADVYIRMSGINDWDLAAGHAIVEAAGGKITAIDGQRLVYNTEQQRLNPFVVYGKTKLEWLKYVDPQRSLEYKEIQKDEKGLVS